MAKRKSLNRRSGRFSRSNADSGHLDPDTRLLGEEEPFWWKNLEDNTIARPSILSNFANETSRILDPTSRIDSSKGKGEWWKHLEESNAPRNERTVRHEEDASDAEDNNKDNVSDDSESGKEQSQKKKPPLRGLSRKSLKGNAFSTALDSSKESSASMPMLKTTKHDLNNSTASDNTDQARSKRPRKSLSSKMNHSKSLEVVIKQKPKLIAKRRRSKSRNMFDDVLTENVLDTPSTVSLRKSTASEHQEGNEDNESIIASQARVSPFGTSFDNMDSEASNTLVPKAQSTMLENTVQMNLSDSSISEKNVQKQKPKVLKWTTKSAQSNHFEDILTNEDSLEKTEENIRKNDLIKEKSQHKQSSPSIPRPSIRNSSVISNKKMSTSIQKQQKGTSFVDQNDVLQVDFNESGDSSQSDVIVNPAYKPKSKFLNAWKQTNQQEDTSESHTVLGEELENVEQSNMRAKNRTEGSDTELYDAALRMSCESNGEESDNPKEHKKSEDDSLTNKMENKSSRVASSHLENSATFNNLNLLSRKSRISLNNSQKSTVHTTHRSSKVPDDKLTESVGDHSANGEIASTKDVLHDETHKSRDTHDRESLNSDKTDANDGDIMKQSLRRNPRSKPSPHRMSRTTSTTAIMVEDDTRKEDDQVVGRTMRSSTHSIKLNSSKNSFFKNGTVNEADQSVEQSTRKKQSQSTSSNSVSKGSKTETMTIAAEDDAYKEEDQTLSRSSRRNTSNKSSSRRIFDSPSSKLAKSANTFLSASDSEDEVDDKKRRSSRTNLRKRSSRSVPKSTNPTALRTRISTVADDDAEEEDNQIISQSTRRSTSNKSSPRRISDSSKATKTTTTLLPVSDTDDEIDENKRQSSTIHAHERSSRSAPKSANPKALRTRNSTVADDDAQEEDDQVIRRSTRGSTYNKSSSRRISDSPKAAKTTTHLPESDTDDEIDENKRRSSKTNTHERSSRRISRSTTSKASRTNISTIVEDDAHKEDDQVIGRSTRRSILKSSSRHISDSPSKAAKTTTILLPVSDTDDEIDENKRQSSTIHAHERSSRSVPKSASPKALRTRISTIVDDDSQEGDNQVIGRNTRRSVLQSSSRRISDSPSKAAKTTTTLSPGSDIDDGIDKNKRGSSKTNTQERSSRRTSKSITTKASRTNISTIVEDDAHEEDDQVIGRSTRRSILRSSSRRISDSPSKAAKTTTTLSPGSDIDDEIDKNKRRSSRTNTHERSSRRISKSITAKASRTNISTIAEDDDQVVRRNTSRSTRKSVASRSKHGINMEVSVNIKKLPAGIYSASKSSQRESMTLVDDKENSTQEAENPPDHTTNEKLIILDDDENGEDEDDTETFQLIASRNGRSSTTSENVGRDLSSRIFKGRSVKNGASYKGDSDLGAEADMESIERPKSTSFRKPSNRISVTSEVKHSTLSDDRVSENNDSISEKMRPSTKTKTVSEERRSHQNSNVPEVKTPEESVANVEKGDNPSVRLTRLITSSPKSSTTERRLEISSDSEDSDLEIMSKSHRKEIPMQSIVLKRRSDASTTSDEEETGKENEIHHSESIGRKSVNNTPSRKTLNLAAARNHRTKSTTNLRDAHFTQDNASTEEDQDTARSGATVASSLEKGYKVRDMSSFNISNISKRSPLLSSTRRSMFPTAASKRVSKLPSQRSSKFSAMDNPPILPVEHQVDDDFVAQEDEGLEPGNRKSGIHRSRISGSDQKKLSDGSSKAPNTAEELASPSVANNGEDDAGQIGHRLHRVNNTIPEETFASYNERTQNGTQKEQSAQNQYSIAKPQKRANEDVEKRTIADKSRKNGMPAKFSQTESRTQRSMTDFLQGKERKAFNWTLFSTQTNSKSQLPSASQVLSDSSKMKEFKKQMEEFLKKDETVSVRKKPNVSPPKKAKPVKKVTTLLNFEQNVKPKKSIDSAFLVNGKVYKPPPLPRPKYWVSNRLYKYLDKFLLPKYGISTRVRSEKFIKHLVDVTTLAAKRKKYSNYKDDVDRLMKEMAHLGIIKNRNDFYDFCHNFLPFELRVKLVPMIRPGNEETIPYNPNELYTPLLK